MSLSTALAGLLHLPLTVLDRVVWRVREQAWRRQFGRVGRNFVFDPVSSKFVTPGLLTVGDDCFLNAQAHVSGDVRMADRVLVGPGVKLLSGNHLYGLHGYHMRHLKATPDNPELLEIQRIESDVWIGAGALVIGGVTLGEGCVLAAGAVASRDIPPYVVAGGVPARPLRRIFDDPDLHSHLLALGQSAAAADALVERRQRACTPGLPLATPAQPAQFLYQGRWVRGTGEGEL